MTLELKSDRADGIVRIELVGELDYTECFRLDAEIKRIERYQEMQVIIDASELHYLDSSGLGLLLKLYRDLDGRGGRMVLVDNETIKNILYLTRLEGLFYTASTPIEAEALLMSHPAPE